MQSNEHVVPSLSGLWRVVDPVKFSNQEKVASLQMQFCDWLLLIPQFDGQPHILDPFIESVRYVATNLGPNAERTLLLALGTKLIGQARFVLAHRLHRYANLDEFLSYLRAYFVGFGNEVELFEELQRARQSEKESSAEFATRLDRLVTQLYNIYEGESNSEARSLIKERALVSFRRGLRNAELEIRLNASDPKTLEEAATIALVLENELRYKERLLEETRRWYRKHRSR